MAIKNKLIKFLIKNDFITLITLVIIANAILDLGFKIDSFFTRLVILIPFIILFYPKKSKIQTETGEKTKIAWFFFKKSIIID